MPLLLLSSVKGSAEKSQSKSESLFIARKPNPKEANKPPETIFVLTPHSRTDQTTAVANEILKLASERGLQARSMIWPPEMSEATSQSVISLLEMESSFLSDISPEDFNMLKSLLLGTSHMLWVTKGDDPVMNAATGYLRSLKNENPNLNTRYLRVEDRLNRNFSDVADVIMKAAVTPSIEREFVEIEGRLCINRWAADKGISRTLVNDKSAVPFERMAIGESLGGLELVLGNPEKPDSFYFDAMTDSTVEFNSTEVEIEVKAIGLKLVETLLLLQR